MPDGHQILGYCGQENELWNNKTELFKFQTTPILVPLCHQWVWKCSVRSLCTKSNYIWYVVHLHQYINKTDGLLNFILHVWKKFFFREFIYIPIIIFSLFKGFEKVLIMLYCFNCLWNRMMSYKRTQISIDNLPPGLTCVYVTVIQIYNNAHLGTQIEAYWCVVYLCTRNI